MLLQSFVGACHLKNYCFVITYLLEDEQELSLGMLIRCKRIYNFDAPCLFYTNYLDLSMLRGTFYAFSRTNILTRCHSANSCFLLFFVSEILHRKYFRNWTGQKPKILYLPCQHRRPRGSQRHVARRPHLCQAA